jgi:KDO2-lipid IV(A) lauroyltransferase
VAPPAAVAERLKPEKLFEKFVAHREALGLTVLPLTGSDVNIMGALGDHLRNGGLVCLPADRDLSGKGVPVTFFGEQTRMPAGPAMLALRTGAELIPTAIRYEGKEPNHVIVIHFGEPVEPPARSSEGKGNGRVANMTQQVADAFARQIAQYPADWHMMQRLFLADLQPDDPRRAQQRGQE